LVLRGWSNCEDGSEVVLGILACTAREGSLARKAAAMLDMIIGVIIGARPVRREHVGQSMGLVEVEVKLVAARGS
jgi:hypothetical protein